MGKGVRRQLDMIKSLILGLITGAAEFLPVCAPAHRRILRAMLGLQDSAAVTMMIHLGCLCALIVAQWRQLLRIRREMRVASSGKRRHFRQPDMLAVADGKVFLTACVPMVLSLMVGSRIGDWVGGRLWLLALLLFLNGFGLYLTRFLQPGNRGSRDMSALDAVLLGLCNITEFVPGISRVGSCMVAAELRKCDREYAVSTALLISTGWMLGMLMLDFVGVITAPAGIIVWLCALLAGLAAFGGAYGAILLIRYLAVRLGYHGFCYYSWGLGFACFIFYLLI